MSELSNHLSVITFVSCIITKPTLSERFRDYYWCSRQRFRDNSWLQQTLCKQFEVARFENLFWKAETLLCQQHGYGSMTRASPTFKFPGHFCWKNISTFNKKRLNANDSKLKAVQNNSNAMQQCCLSRNLNIRNLVKYHNQRRYKNNNCLTSAMTETDQKHYTAAWVSVASKYLTQYTPSYSWFQLICLAISQLTAYY